MEFYPPCAKPLHSTPQHKYIRSIELYSHGHMYKAPVLHASLVKNGLIAHVYQCNILLQAYINSQALSDAHKLLHFMPQPSVVSYNTILSGYFKFGLVSEAIKLFDGTSKRDCHSWNIVLSGCVKNHKLGEGLTHFMKMRCSSVRPDNFTYAIIIPCCDLGFGQQVHADIVKVCSDLDAFIGTNLLRMYAEVGEIGDARKVFDGMPSRGLVTWNAMISCYSKYGRGDKSIGLFRQLGREGISADEYTYAIVLNEFAARWQVFEAMQVHSLIIERGFCSDRFTNNALVNLYSKCGYVASASRLFEEIPDQDVVSWTVIIVGFLQSGHMEEAMWLFYQMQLGDIEPNSFTFGGLLGACADANAFQKGRHFHGLVLKFGLLGADVVVGSAVVDMYSKCGEMGDALRAFQEMPERDIASWNGIICGYAQNGAGMKALKLYNEMVLLGPSGIAPNEVTFVGVLCACSHNGLLKEGYSYFKEMVDKHLIKPTAEHYTCMVDLLGRAGLLQEAEALILALPIKPDNVMWGALLGACKLHGDVQMTRRTAEHLYTNEPRNSSNYVLLANSYTDIGEWGEAVEIREVMQARGVEKTAGRSWVEIGTCMHSFLAGDELHPQIEVASQVLQRLYLQMRERYEHDEVIYSLN